MRSLKSAKKTKMADEGRVSVNSKQTVLRIHEKLKKEVHQIADKKSWTAKQKDEFEKKLLEVGQLSDFYHFPCSSQCIGNMHPSTFIILKCTVALIALLVCVCLSFTKIL